jgi:hypothetical protein
MGRAARKRVISTKWKLKAKGSRFFGQFIRVAPANGDHAGHCGARRLRARVVPTRGLRKRREKESDEGVASAPDYGGRDGHSGEDFRPSSGRPRSLRPRTRGPSRHTAGRTTQSHLPGRAGFPDGKLPVNSQTVLLPKLGGHLRKGHRSLRSAFMRGDALVDQLQLIV